jgi:hypothetical protein
MMKAFKKVSFLTQTCLISASLLTTISAVGAVDPNVAAAAKVNAAVKSASSKLSLAQYYTKPFATNSLWNSRPISPTFSNYVIPVAKYYPEIQSSKYSSGCFFADENSSSMILKPLPGQPGVYDADAETYEKQIVIPHWPNDLVPASGGDGHADIYDVADGVIHSFYQLKNIDGEWRARLYAWSKIDGRGWADPAQYYQGARAVGISACAGMIRKHEYLSNDLIYPHALAMSLDTTGAAPGYVFPATSADSYSGTNTGKIPEGALVMLPPSFDVTKLKTPELVKIAKTLKVFGAYIVDGNYGTPFVIYAETNSGLVLHKNGRWNSTAAEELQVIRQALRMVTSVKSWVDASGQPFIPEKNLNVLSMRGPWGIKRNNVWSKNDPMLGKFDTWKQAVVFGPTTTPIVQSNLTGRSFSQVTWAKPKAGEKFKLTAVTTGGGKLRVIMYDQQWKTKIDTYDMANGQSTTFVWPTGQLYFIVQVTSGVGKSSSVSGTLVRVN